MLAEEVRIDGSLNKYLWSQGIRNVPRRVRILLKPQADKKVVTVYHVPVDRYKGLGVEKEEDEEAPFDVSGDEE